MRIKKINDVVPKASHTVNEYSESTKNTYSCNYINGETLYEDSTGTTGNITLSDNIQNYKHIMIYGKMGNFLLIGQDFFTNNQNNFQLQVSYNTNGGGIIYPCGTNYLLNNKSMTVVNHYRIGLYGNDQGYASESNSFEIVKIVGYRNA